MAFVPRYDNDIFISYSHTDNVPLIADSMGWVDFFEDVLRKRIRVRLRMQETEDVKIFRDAQLRRYGQFSKQIAYELPNSAIFLCVLSPGYVGSEWCLRELRDFSSSSTDRIIKVVKTAFDDPPAKSEPKLLLTRIEEILDCRFYSKDESSGLVSDLQPEVVPAHVPQFLEKIDVVAQNLVGLLKDLRVKGMPANHPVPATPDDENRITVYVAETTKDLISKRDEIRTELSQFNCRILPEQPLPQDAEQLVTQIKEYLEQAKFSVHLLGPTYGLVPESEERSVPHIQCDIATQVNNSGQLIWIPDNLVPTDPRQQSLINRVKNDAAEVLQTKIEDLKTEIHKRLKPSLNPDWGDDADTSINVSLFCHEQDMASVGPLYSHLTMNELFRVKFPLREGDSIEGQKGLTQTSDAVLLYYGAADEDWFVNIWKFIQRQISAAKNKPLLAKAIYAGRPSTIEKTLLESEDPIIIKNYDAFTPNSISPFVARIRAAKGGVQ